MSNLIQVAELAKQLGDPNLVIIDTRYALSDLDYGRHVYTEAHLPGAIYLDLATDLSDPLTEHGGRHPLPDPARLAQVLGRCGIGNQSEVVVYDDAGGMYAGRLWWLLRWLGHDAVRVLDGGYPAWKTAGQAITSEESLPIARHFVPRPRPDMLLSMEEVRSRLNRGGITLLDARAPERYRGETEPLDPQAGHIPGALNRPFADNLDPQKIGCFKSAEQLRHDLTPLELECAQEVIVYCGSGVTACHNLLALEEAGYRGARLYAGSWSDWVSYAENPVETGGKS